MNEHRVATMAYRDGDSYPHFMCSCGEVMFAYHGDGRSVFASHVRVAAVAQPFLTETQHWSCCGGYIEHTQTCPAEKRFR